MKKAEEKQESAARPFVSKEGIAISKRFFMAVDTLKLQGKLHGLLVFTNKHNINRWNLYTVKNNPEKATLKPEYIYYLCSDYNVSLEWIFYGTGDFYNIPRRIRRTKHDTL